MKINHTLLLLILSFLSCKAPTMDYIAYDRTDFMHYPDKINKTLYVNIDIPSDVVDIKGGPFETRVTNYRKSLNDAALKIFSASFDEVEIVDKPVSGQLNLKIWNMEPFWQSFSNNVIHDGRVIYEYNCSYNALAILTGPENDTISSSGKLTIGYINLRPVRNIKTENISYPRWKEVIQSAMVSVFTTLNDDIFLKEGIYEKLM